MAKSKESFDRRQRERAKKAKAELKREARFNKEASTDEEADDAAPKVDQDVVLDQLAKLHATYDDERISFEDFETRRAELLAQLQV